MSFILESSKSTYSGVIVPGTKRLLWIAILTALLFGGVRESSAQMFGGESYGRGGSSPTPTPPPPPPAQTQPPKDSKKKPAAKKSAAPKPKQATANYSPNNPLRCFWTSDKASIRVGELLRVRITCLIRETKTQKVFFEERQLDPSALNFAPFEAVSHEEVFLKDKKGYLRRIQRVYEMRIVGGEFFGKEIGLPQIELAYSLKNITPQGEEFQQQESRYKMAALTMKVQSLVSSDASDIRDASWRTMKEIIAGRFRAMFAFVLGGFFFAAAIVLIIVQVLSLFRAGKKRGDNLRREKFGERDLIKKVLSAAERIQNLRAKNIAWDAKNEELLGRALAVSRTCGAFALGRSVATSVLGMDEKGLEGQLRFKIGRFSKRRQLAVYASITPEEMKSALGEKSHTGICKEKPGLIQEFLSAFETLSIEHYLEKVSDVGKLDAALQTCITTLKVLRSEASPWRRFLQKRRRKTWKR